MDLPFKPTENKSRQVQQYYCNDEMPRPYSPCVPNSRHCSDQSLKGVQRVETIIYNKTFGSS